MGYTDDLLKEKQIIKQTQVWIEDDQVGTTELSDTVGMDTSDIADGAIDEDKIATAAVDATKGCVGGSGTLIAAVPDGTIIEMDGGVTPAKKLRIADTQVAAAHLGAVAGKGCSGGAGTALDIECAAAGGLEVNAGDLQLLDATVPAAKLGASAKYRRISIPLTILGAGGTRTIRNGVLSVPTGKTYTITKATVSAYTAPTDANGTILGSLIKYQGGAPVDIVTDHDMEFTDLTGSDMTIITAAAANVVTATSHVYFEVVVDDLGADDIDIDWVAPVLTIEFTEF